MRARVSRLWFSREKAADVERKAAAARFSPDGSFAKKEEEEEEGFGLGSRIAGYKRRQRKLGRIGLSEKVLRCRNLMKRLLKNHGFVIQGSRGRALNISS